MAKRVQSRRMGEELARERIEAARETQRLLLKEVGVIAAIADKLTDVLRNGGKVLFCGNGGSASDSLHLATELAGRFYKDRAPLAALALVADSAMLTATGNDYGFDQVFARQVTALGRPGDALVAISTSGTSPNVVAAVEAALAAKMAVIGLTGESGGRLAELCEPCLCAPSRDTPRIQECHILAGHIVCESIERSIFDN